MEVKIWDAVIVSAFGRGNWLAVELREQGLNVFLVDVTSSLGNWPTEDLEGPFGVFMLKDFKQSFQDYIHSLGPFENIASGFAIWTSEGPLELRSPVTSHRFKKMGLHSKIWEVLNQQSTAQKFINEPFEKIWPLGLSHQMASTTYHPNKTAAQSGTAAPVLDPFLIRKSSKEGYDKSLSWVESKGVKVSRDPEILDIALGGRRRLEALELKGPGVFRFENLIWSLSSEETYYLNDRIAKKIFPQGALESTWSWLRFRLKVKPTLEIDMIPSHVCIIDDLAMPWTHENFCLLQKSASGSLDAWIRLPSVQRFNKEYLKEMGQRICRLFGEKVPPSMPEVESYPQEYYLTYKELGAPRFPIFLPDDDSTRRYSFFENLYRDGFEVWNNFTRDSQAQAQSNLRDEVVKVWRQDQLKKKKEMDRLKKNQKELQP